MRERLRGLERQCEGFAEVGRPVRPSAELNRSVASSALVIGEAAQGSPAQARVRDARGRTHYVMLEPDEPGQRFKTGDSVLLIARSGAVFRAIRSDSPALSNPPT